MLESQYFVELYIQFVKRCRPLLCCCLTFVHRRESLNHTLHPARGVQTTFVQAAEATAPGLDPGVEADSIIMLKTV